MFKLKQKTKTASLSLALAAAMTGGVMMGTPTSVEAINIAQDGIGEVLIFPYYTVREGWQTYLNLTNTSNRTVMVRVRWHEGVNSRDVRDFNVVLSPYDVWTAVVAPTEDGKGARMFTSDSTCTVPALNAEDGYLTSSGIQLLGKKFTNAAYTSDSGDSSLDRTKEGYFTVIEMGVALDENVQTALDAKHDGASNNKGKPDPLGCANIVKRTRDNLTALQAEFGEPENLIKGRSAIINAENGIAMGYDPTVLANCYNPSNTEIDGKDEQNLITEPSNDLPNLTSCQNGNIGNEAYAEWIDDTPGIGPQYMKIGASVARASYGIGSNVLGNRSIDAVSVLFHRAALVNDYNIAGGSATDWVVTLPTKRYYVDESNHRFAGVLGVEDGFGGVVPIPPFTTGPNSINAEGFGLGKNPGEACFDVNYRLWDREESELIVEGGLEFSPAPPPGEANRLCYETNIITFGEAVKDETTGKPISNAMKSKLAVAIESLPGEYGWSQLEFGAVGGKSLPVIGMRLEVRKKESAEVSFGFANTHSYKRVPANYDSSNR